jgi:hypothetical protein
VIIADAAVVEQQSQPVMVEVAVAAGDSLGVLDLQVEVLGRSVAHRGVVEVFGVGVRSAAAAAVPGLRNADHHRHNLEPVA